MSAKSKASKTKPIKRLSDLKVGLALCGFVFAVNLITMPRTSYSGDPVAMRMATVSLIDEGKLDIAPARAQLSTRGQFFVENSRNGKFYSKYGIFNSLMFLPPIFMDKKLPSSIIPAAANGKVESGTFYLNLYNLLLTLFLTFYLFRLASLYSDRTWARVIFVLTSLYTTFLWNYTRAQTAELFQVLFFVALFYHLIALKRAKTLPAKEILLSVFFLGLLCLSKFSEIILIPAAAAWFLVAGSTNAEQGIFSQALEGFRGHAKKFIFLGVLPMLGIMALLFFLNYYQFGSALDTGYNQWARYSDSFAGSIFEGLYGFLIRTDRNIFLHFPLLAFSIFGVKKFYTKHRLDYLWIASVSLVFLLIISKLPFWAGEASYGPRLLLFFLPVLSLPFIETLHLIQDHWQKTWIKAATAAMAIALLYSLQLQMNVNRFQFFTFYTVQNAVIKAGDLTYQNITNDRFFKLRHFGVINGELIDYKNSGTYPAFDYAKPILDPGRFNQMQGFVNSLLDSNYYWF